MDPIHIDMRLEDDSVEIEDIDIPDSSHVSGQDNGRNTCGKKRKLTSKVWQVFDMLPIESDNVKRCKCKGCGKIYVADSKFGTGNISRYIKSCVRLQSRDVGQMLMESDCSMRASKFSHEKFREIIISAIIRHELPFQFVEYEGIREAFQYLNMDVKHVTRNITKSDVRKLYERELGRLSMFIRECPGRICLTSDLWTSIVTDGYLSLTAHFVDKDWVLQKRILNFSYMPPPHSGIALSEKIYNLLCTWGIENRLFSITLDNASANDTFVDLLKTQLCLKDALLDSGSFFHIRCCAHIFNLIVQEGLKVVDYAVGKIRDCVKYVKGLQVRKQKFFECVGHVSLDCKKALRQDVPTRWNSTYLMLSSALYYKRAFCHLQLSDSNFKHCPSFEEWDKIEKLCKFLQLFYDVTCIFSGIKYPTANLYFEKVWLVQLYLTKELHSLDDFLSNMAKQMHEKFSKCWSEYSLILAMAVIFDHRYKIQFVEFCYKKLYGDSSSECSFVREKLFSLFDEYMQKAAKPSPSPSTSRASDEIHYRSKDCLDILKEFDVFESKEFPSNSQKNQLELYLDEQKIDRSTKLNVLAYWKALQYRYPELANMARDILSIPISTVVSESAFSMGGRILNEYRSALKPDVVEALVCTKDWMFGGQAFEEVSLDELMEDILHLIIHKNPQSVESSNQIQTFDI